MILSSDRNNETTQGDKTGVVKVLEELEATNNSHSKEDHAKLSMFTIYSTLHHS